MPFQKVGPNQYVSPSGRKFNEKQVKLYYATDGFSRMGKGQFAGGGAAQRRTEAASVRADTLPKKRGR